MFLIGDTHRSISSTAEGTSSGSASNLCFCSGCSSSCSIPPAVTWRVVSSPPMSRRSDSKTISSSSSRSPSTSAWTRTLKRSSRRLGAAVGDHPVRVLDVLAERLGRDLEGLGLTCERRQHAVRPPQQIVAVGGCHAEHVADDDHRQRCREVVHEVAFTPLADAVDQVVADVAEVRLGRPDAAGGEPATHELPALRMRGAVDVDHPRKRPGVGATSARARERLRVALRGEDAVVTWRCPTARCSRRSRPARAPATIGTPRAAPST